MKMSSARIVPGTARSFRTKAGMWMLAAAAVTAVSGGRYAGAATLTWDSSGTATTTPVDGGGTWSTSAANWFNGVGDVGWPNDTTIAVFGNGGTAGTVTLGSAITAGGLMFNTSVSDYIIAGGGNLLTLTGPPVVTVAAGQSPTINAGLAGTVGFALNGPGTLNLGGDNSALSGAIAINSGTLVVNAGSNLGAATNNVTIGTAATTTTGGLTLAAGVSTTVNSLSANSNGTGVNALNIGNGATLSVTSSAALAGLNATVNGAVVIGTPNIAGAISTLLTATGGGTLNVSGGSGNSSFIIGVGNTNTSTSVATTTVDLTGLSNFSFTTGTGAVPTGGGNEFAVGHGNGATSTLSLATNNIVTAGTITVGDNSVTPGLSATINQPNAPSNPSTLNLGSGNNTLNANSFIIGSGRSQGIIQWANATTTGTLTIAGAAGGSSTANITIGNLPFGTPPSSASNLSLKGHSVTVQAGTVIIGELSGSSGGKNTTNAGGSVTFDTGTFSAANIRMAMNVSGTSSDNLSGTLNVGSSANSTGTFTVTGSFWIADNTNTTNAVSLSSGAFVVKGGTANIGANIIDASTTTVVGSSTGTLTLSGGTLNMQGFAIGPVIANPNNATLSTKHIAIVLPTNTATLLNLGGTGINDAGLTMNGTGTLILSGNNSYSGTTTISSGTLQVGAATDTAAPVAPFTTGTTIVTDNATLSFGSSQTLVMAGAINGSGGINQNGTGTTILSVNNGYAGATAISKGTLQIGNGGLTGTVSSAAVTNNGTLAFNRSDPSLTFANTISGSGAVSQLGSGTVVLTGNNTFTGGVSVNNGTLKTGNGNALGFGGLVAHTPGGATVNAAGTLDLAGQAVTEAITLNGGTLVNSGAGTATVGSGVVAVGVTSSTGGLSGDAAVTISGGGGSGAAATAVLGLSAGSFTVTNGGTNYANGTVAVTITGGGGTGATGTATVVNNAVTTINITNPGTGYTTAPTITIVPPTGGTTATADGNANNFVLDGIQQTATGSGYTTTPTATLTSTSGSAVLGTPLVSGIVLPIGTSGSIGGTGNVSVAGAISGGGTLVKTGGSTLTLSAPGTYTGGTTVNGGTVVVSNTGGTALGIGAVTLNGGTLAGTGSFTGGFVGGSGSHVISPGAPGAGSIGTLTVGDLATNANTTLALDLASPAGTNDLLAAGNVTLGGGSVAVTSQASTGNVSLGYYKVISYSGALTGAASAMVMPAVNNNIAYTLDTTHDAGFIDIHRGYIGDATDDGVVDLNDLNVVLNNLGVTTSSWSLGNFDGAATIDLNDLNAVLNHLGTSIPAGAVVEALTPSSVAATPEPATIGLLALGVFGLLTRRRRV